MNEGAAQNKNDASAMCRECLKAPMPLYTQYRLLVYDSVSARGVASTAFNVYASVGACPNHNYGQLDIACSPLIQSRYACARKTRTRPGRKVLLGCLDMPGSTLG